LADRRLDPDRSPGRRGDHLDEVEQAVDVREGRVPRRTRTVRTLGDAADLGYLAGDLGGGQQATETGLGTLAELDLDRPDRCRVDDLDEAVEREVPGPVTAAEVRRTDLEDQVTALAVVRREAA